MIEKVYVFGRGEYYEEKSKYLHKGYVIVGFLDNAIKNGKTEFFQGKKAYNPSVINKAINYPVLIMTSRNYICEVVNQLLDLGVAEKDIRFGTNIYPPMDSAEEIVQREGGMFVEKGKCTFIYHSKKLCFSSYEEYISIMFRLLREEHPFVSELVKMPSQPLSRSFGREYGEPIDRVYIERFLKDNSHYIKGVIAEIGEDIYTKKYSENMTKSIIFHLSGRNGAVIGNLETGEGIENDMIDCLICTQTIQMIYDQQAVANNVYRILKPGGVALITAHGISQISQGDDTQWGEHWRFTNSSLRRIYGATFGNDNVEIVTYGNVKTATCFLYGLVQEDMKPKDYEYNDPQYPVIVGTICIKQITKE